MQRDVLELLKRIANALALQFENAPPEPEHIVVDQSHQKANRRRQGRRPPPPAQRQTAHHEPYVVPDQVHQHLPGVEIGEHVVLI